jgi:GH15 family glucan-1,4-alpha-glucosidase
MFERLLGLRNHLGLLAEEYAPKLGRQLGNFPQPFRTLESMSLALETTASPTERHICAPLRGEGATAIH